MKKPTVSELKRSIVVDALRDRIVAGYSYDSAWKEIDSVYYNITTDTIE